MKRWFEQKGDFYCVHLFEDEEHALAWNALAFRAQNKRNFMTTSPRGRLLGPSSLQDHRGERIDAVELRRAAKADRQVDHTEARLSEMSLRQKIAESTIKRQATAKAQASTTPADNEREYRLGDHRLVLHKGQAVLANIDGQWIEATIDMIGPFSTAVRFNNAGQKGRRIYSLETLFDHIALEAIK